MRALILGIIIGFSSAAIGQEHCELIQQLKIELAKRKEVHKRYEDFLISSGHRDLVPAPPTGEYKTCIEQYNRWTKWEAEMQAKNCFRVLMFARMPDGVALFSNNDKLFMPVGSFALKGVPPTLIKGQVYSGYIYPCGDYKYTLVGGKSKTLPLYALSMDAALLEMEDAYSKAKQASQ
jgi:hypothetical protein